MAKTSAVKKSGRLENYMEVLTGNILDDLLLEYKGSRFTPDAKRDIRALALNRLWPMYTTTPKGKDFIRKTVSQDNVEKDVVRELRAAIDIVRSNPRR